MHMHAYGGHGGSLPTPLFRDLKNINNIKVNERKRDQRNFEGIFNIMVHFAKKETINIKYHKICQKDFSWCVSRSPGIKTTVTNTMTALNVKRQGQLLLKKLFWFFK